MKIDFTVENFVVIEDNILRDALKSLFHQCIDFILKQPGFN